MTLIINLLALIAGFVFGWQLAVLMIIGTDKPKVKLGVAIGSLLLAGILRLVNYFFSDDDETGGTALIVSLFGGMIVSYLYHSFF